MLCWVGTIEGPANTARGTERAAWPRAHSPRQAFEGQSYKLQLKFPAEYPYAAPTVEFAKHAMFHPNVHFETGGICLDILKDKWSPMYDVRTILLSIQSLLGGAETCQRLSAVRRRIASHPSPPEPNNESPLNGKAAALWSNAAEYKAVVVKTAEHASL